MDTLDVSALLTGLRQLGNDHATCEVKRAQGGLPVSTWETLSAFANAQGGHLMLGIDERRDFEVVGVHNPAAMEAQLGATCSEMEPAVRAEIFTTVIEGGSVVVCHVPPLPRDQRPCHKRSLGPWAGSRIRVSDGDRKLTDYDVAVLLANRTEQRHDLTPVTGATVAALDQDLLERYLRRIRETKGEIFRKVDDEQALLMLNVVTQHQGKVVPTLAGLLAFGIYPQTYEPQLDLTFVAYPTPAPGVLGSAGERFVENRSLDGPIPMIVSECIRVLKRNMKRRSIISGIYRMEEWEYPEEVLREALVNALVHRDYSEFARGMQVQVEMFPDRLIIRNPGGLYGPVEVSSLGTTTVTSSRNKALLKILEDTPYGDGHMVCENRGSGITRMRVALTEAGMEPPRFADDIASFTAEFPNHTLLDEEALGWLQCRDTGPLTRAQMTALVMMRNGMVLTNSVYRASTGIQDSRAASRELKELVDRGLVDQQGTRGGATYRLTGKKQTESNTLFPAADRTRPHSERPAPPGLSPHETTVHQALAEGQRTRAELAQVTGLTVHQVRRVLDALRAKGLVEMLGQERLRNTRYQLVDLAGDPAGGSR